MTPFAALRPAPAYAALLVRELGAPRQYVGPAVAIAAGVAAAWLATFVQPGSGGMATILTRFDISISSVVALLAVLRTIDRIVVDAEADWMLQHVAAGMSRMTYVAALVICVTIGALMLYAAGALAFGVATQLLTGDTQPLATAAARLPLYLLMVLGASAFGAAIGVITRGRSAIHIALLLIAAPWIGMWAAVVLRENNPLGGPIRLLSYPPPRLFSAYTLAHVSYALLYAGVMLGIALSLAHTRIGRRS